MEFPPFSEGEGDTRVTVEWIIGKRLGKRFAQDSAATRRTQLAICFFGFLRDQERERLVGRRPTLAELLNWLDYLMPPNTPDGPSDWQVLAALEQDANPALFHRLLGSIDSLLLKRPRDSVRGSQATAVDLIRAWHDQSTDIAILSAS